MLLLHNNTRKPRVEYTNFLRKHDMPFSTEIDLGKKKHTSGIFGWNDIYT